MTDAELKKRRKALYALCAVIVLIAILIILAPASVPGPAKVGAACGDLFAAAFVWLAARQLTGSSKR